MSESNQNDNLNFDLPKNQSSVIKVIGVGGGGSNAVNHMYSQGIRGVDFIVSNTDSQALENSPVPNKIQLGVTLTEGLGAGANPEIGEKAAIESIDEVKNLLSTNTKMLFITAGMGGGTGTGAAPVIAKAAKDLDILTVGIVTIPFIFEGNNRKQQAEKGVDALRENVDSLVVINNNKLREVYGNLGFKAGFAKADEVLATAARGIAEVITHHYTANIDLRDAKTVLANSGTAIMGAAVAKGDNRASKAINAALDSPLLNDNHIRGAKNVLLLIVSGQEEITIDEIGEINDFIQNEAGGDANIIMGIGENEDLGDEISVTIVATGFNPEQQESTIGRMPEKVIHTLEDDQEVSSSIYNKPLQTEAADEEEEDDFIDQELDRVMQAREAEKSRQQQASLFEYEQEEEIEEDLTEAPLSRKAEEAASMQETEPEEEKPIRHQLSPEEEEEATAPDAAEEGLVFEIEEDEGAEPSIDFEVRELPERGAEEKKETPSSKKTEPNQEESFQTEKPPKETAIRRYSLEDYTRLEEELSAAQPAEKSSKPAHITDKAEPEEESLRFEVKTKAPETKRTGDNNRQHSPFDGPIEESLQGRAEERRAKLKAFNYRFKNHPNGINDADNEPAYKRQGVDISNERLSRQKQQGRLSVNDGENGSDLRSNNRFLHDNVD